MTDFIRGNTSSDSPSSAGEDKALWLFFLGGPLALSLWSQYTFYINNF